MHDDTPNQKPEEQPPVNRSTKYEDYNIFELEQQEKIESVFQMKKTPSKENPFSGKKYIDDFASSSDELDATSENGDMLPMVEQV